MEVWLTHHGPTELTPGDRAILSSRFQRLSREAFGISELIVETSTVDLKFTNNKRDADYRIMVAPRNVDGVWELLQVALAASTGDEANSLVVPVYYDDEPTQLSYVGLTRLAEIMKPRFAQLERAFAPENYPATHSRRLGRCGYRWVMKKPGPRLASEGKSSLPESNKWIARADDRIGKSAGRSKTKAKTIIGSG